MNINLICEGEQGKKIRCCQGSGIELCTIDQFKVFEGSNDVLDKGFDDSKMYNQIQILEIIISLNSTIDEFPLLDILDYFCFHRNHKMYLEIAE